MTPFIFHFIAAGCRLLAVGILRSFTGPCTLVPGPFFLFTQTLKHSGTQALSFIAPP